MKKILIPILLISSSAFSFQGPLNLKCDRGYSDPWDFKATIQGPKQGFYRLKIVEQYYGFISNYTHDLQLDENRNLAAKEASVRDLGFDHQGRQVIQITSKAVTGLQLICK
jgi:hypothetical protein